jgi:ABC-type transport system involved in multi-copper enzyme maturation permease subunit
MEHEISTGIGIAIVIFFVVAVVAIALLLLAMVKNITNAGATQMQNSVTQILDSRFDDYDQQVVTGSRVKTAIKQFHGTDIGIIVKTTADLKSQSDTAPYGRNYGALLLNLNGGNPTSKSTKVTDGVSGDEYRCSAAPGKASASDAFYTAAFDRSANQTLQFNNNIKPLSRSGYAGFVRDSASFQATLIQDPSGTKIGVVFEQVS